MLAYSLWELGIRNDSPDAGKEALKIFYTAKKKKEQEVVEDQNRR